MSIYLMDDRLHPSGGIRGAAFQAFRTGSLSLEELRLRWIEVRAWFKDESSEALLK